MILRSSPESDTYIRTKDIQCVSAKIPQSG